MKELLISLGYSEEDYELFKNNYALSNYKEETLKEKIIKNYEFLVSVGYTKEEVIKITKSLPPIYSYSIEKIKQKIEDIIALGYTKEEVIKMTKSLPQIYGYSKENMKQKIEDMIALGYTKEEVIKMTKSLPTIYGLSIENMKQKIDFYDSIGLHELLVVDAKQLMQSTVLSYARYMFYKDKGITIDMNNYRKLFINNKSFEKAYGITKEELLKKYDYNKYIEKKEFGGLK